MTARSALQFSALFFLVSCGGGSGNGGGNFRRLYAGFLEWARALDPQLVPESAPRLATEAADGWTALSAELGRIGDDGGPRDAWIAAAAHAHKIAAVEAMLFERLHEAVG